MVYCQVQGNNRIAAFGICQSKCWFVGAFCVGHTVNPSVTIAGGLLVNSCVATVYCQVQGNNRIATVCSHKCLLIITTYVISFIIPLVRITSRDFDKLSQRLVYRQVQSNYRIATCGIGQSESRFGSAFRVGYAVNPSVTITSGLNVGVERIYTMRKVQRYVFACGLRLLNCGACNNITVNGHITHITHIVSILEIIGRGQLCRNAARNAGVLYAASASAAHIYHTYGIGTVANNSI